MVTFFLSGCHKPIVITMDVNIKLTIKACCLYERLAGKSFFKCETVDDVSYLLYAMFITTNDQLITYELFQSMMENKRFARALMQQYNMMCMYLEQLKVTEQFNEYAKGNTGDTGQEMSMTNIASSLIVMHGVDANYVMDKMQIWEIIPYFEAADSKRKMELVDKRFWTYLTILPHVDGKKIKSPDKLFKFDWEKGSKKDYERDLEGKSEYIKQFFAAQRKAREEQEKKKAMEEQNNG